MLLPETTIANQSFLKTGFRSASQVEVFSEAFSTGGSSAQYSGRLYLKTNLSPSYKSYSTPAAPCAQIHLCVLPHLRRLKIFVTQLIR